MLYRSLCRSVIRGVINVEKMRWWQNKRQRSLVLRWLAGILLLLCISGSVLTLDTYQTVQGSYRQSMSLALGGLQHLHMGQVLLSSLAQHTFDISLVAQARREFVAGSDAFKQVNSALRTMPGASSMVPVYSQRLWVSLHLVPLAMQLSQAGIFSCDMLNVLITKFHNPFSREAGAGFTTTDLTLIDDDFHQVSQALEASIAEARQVQPSDLPAHSHFASLLSNFQQNIQALQGWMNAIAKFLPLLPALLGMERPANYLVEILDSTELRPGGGFIGNYGFATIHSGLLVNARISDVGLLDDLFDATGKRIPYPQQYKWLSHYLGLHSWNFRDSNLDADFPTAARNAELLYQREGGNVPVEGVIAITPAAVQLMLSIIGPVNVPEYNEVVTAQNLIERIHYYQLGAGRQGSSDVPAADGCSSQRKHFTGLLAEHVLEHLRHLSPALLTQLLPMLPDALRSKDIQLYFNAPVAEDLLHLTHLDAAMQPTPGDSFMVVDANVAGDKVNPFLVNVIDDQVELTEHGDAIHHTALNYTWAISGPSYGSDLYRSYVRVYTPSQSILYTQSGWSPLGVATAFDHAVWSGDFTLRCCQTRTIALVWTEPDAASLDAQGWHYRYFLQRQAGVARTIHLELQMPACAAHIQVLGGLVAQAGNRAVYTESLDEDQTIGIDYTVSIPSNQVDQSSLRQCSP